MVVAVVAPASSSSTAPIFTFVDAAAWKASVEWKAWASRGDAAPMLHIDTVLDDAALDSTIEAAAKAVRLARTVLLGGKCSARTLLKWKMVGFDRALTECWKAGGVIIALGPVCSMLGSWFRGSTGSLEAGVGLVNEAIIGVCQDTAGWEALQKTVGAAHAAGHERVRGFGITKESGALFVPGDGGARAEAICNSLLEAGPIPKSDAFGKLLRLRTLSVPDEELRNSLGSPCDIEGRWQKALDLAADWLLDAEGTTVVSTGAGVSAESGIPTYRDEGGLWEIYDQMEVSHIKGFARDPEKCWRFELELHQTLRTCGPNAAHKGLAQLGNEGVLKTVITQNVDGLHLAAGSKDVIEIHGSETRGICMHADCRKTFDYVEVFRRLGWMDNTLETTAKAPPLPPKRERTMGGVYAELTDSSDSSSSSSASSSDSEVGPMPLKPDPGPIKFEKVMAKLRAKAALKQDEKTLARMKTGPQCPACGKAVLKPDAVYFGEGLPPGQIKRALQLTKAAKGFLIIGTSGSVAPACKLPRLAKIAGGAKVIEISPRETDLSKDADLLLLATAATAMPALVAAVARRRALRVQQTPVDDASVGTDADPAKATQPRRRVSSRNGRKRPASVGSGTAADASRSRESSRQSACSAS